MATGTTRGQSRAKLLSAAMRCLRDKGYARTTARDLAAASGANLASIGYHFGSKDALLNQALADAMVAWTDDIVRRASVDEEAGTAERLERSLAGMVDRFEELEPYLISFVEAFPQAVRSDDLRERMATAYREARSAGAEQIRSSLEREGVQLEPRHAEVLGSLMTALCDGLILQWLLYREEVPGSGEVMEALRAALPGLEGRRS
jgi:AcrR family transcriptional regulator